MGSGSIRTKLYVSVLCAMFRCQELRIQVGPAYPIRPINLSETRSISPGHAVLYAMWSPFLNPVCCVRYASNRLAACNRRLHAMISRRK